MASTAIRLPALPSLHETAWRDHRPLDLLSRPRTQTERVELPSIRQAVPEIQMRSTRTDSNYRIDSVGNSPSVDFRNDEHGSQKRRRTSVEREEIVIRTLHHQRSRSPLRGNHHSYSTTESPSSRRISVASINNSRSGSTRSSPQLRTQGLPAIRSPPLETANLSQQDWRPTLPGIPAFNLDCGSSSYPAGKFGEVPFEASRVGAHTYPQHVNAYEPPSSHQNTGFSHGYHSQSRGQSFSGSTGRERTPFSAVPHHYSSGANFPYGIEMAETGNEGKQRKRRGNLPKETTDKLRAWFHAHIQHPYPTEDEKQELMRQTGLQMNQISNWFINARRCQLPAMINNARAESEARSARGVELPARRETATEFGSYRDSRSAGLSGESDDGGSTFGEEYEERVDQRTRGPF